jgi:adenylate cyclase
MWTPVRFQGTRRGARERGRVDALIASATDAIVTADEAGLILSWNRAAERAFGYEASEVLGESLTILMPERFREAHTAGHARVVGTGETRVIGQTVELAGLHRDGREFPIELSLSTWMENGRRLFAGIIRDVTERERLNRELTESRERLQAILSSANDAIICADGEGLVLLWNSAAERLLGHREEDMLGKPLTTIIPERFREAHLAGVRRAAAGGEPRVIGRTVELAAVRADGTEFPVELSLSTWETPHGRYFGGIIRDVTERKRAEEEIRASGEALREKNQELEGLSAKLAKYLSRQLYESIFSGRTDVEVKSYRKKLTIFFSDIEGFTELTDSMEAEPLSELLNEYLSEMAAIASRHGGTIDKFIGDGVMIFFGDPDTRGDAEDAIACVEMALEMRERVHSLRAGWRARGVTRPLHIRIGINTGYSTVGNFGSEDRLDYTIVGGQVNVASRLEASAGPDGILISEETYALVKDAIHCEPVGAVKVKGIAYPLKTYRVVGRRSSGAEVPPIDEERAGFRLRLDAASLDRTALEDARAALRRGLEALDRAAGDEPAVALDGDGPR